MQVDEKDTYQGFLSYCRVDDEEGDITKLHKALEKELRRVWNRDCRIYINKGADGSFVESASIIETSLTQPSCLIAMVSPNFIESDQCRTEIDAFQNSAIKNNGGVHIFPILLVPVPLSRQNDFFHELSSARFADYTQEKFSQPTEKSFRILVSQVALHIAARMSGDGFQSLPNGDDLQESIAISPLGPATSNDPSGPKYYVITSDGQKFGPVDLETINHWAGQMIVYKESPLIHSETGFSLLAGQLPGIQFPIPPPPVIEKSGNPTQLHGRRWSNKLIGLVAGSVAVVLILFTFNKDIARNKKNESASTLDNNRTSKPVPGASGDDLAKLANNSEATITDAAKAATLIQAGDAYKEAGDIAKSYQSYLQVYQILSTNGASKHQLREILYKMLAVCAPGSPERAEVDRAISDQI